MQFVFRGFFPHFVFSSQGGIYIFQLFDYYAASGMVLLSFCFFECVAISWFYGISKWYDNVEDMIGRRINPFLKICWVALTPALTLVSKTTTIPPPAIKKTFLGAPKTAKKKGFE